MYDFTEKQRLIGSQFKQINIEAFDVYQVSLIQQIQMTLFLSHIPLTSSTSPIPAMLPLSNTLHITAAATTDHHSIRVLTTPPPPSIAPFTAAHHFAFLTLLASLSCSQSSASSL